MTVAWSPLSGKLPRHGARDGNYRYDEVEAELAVRFFRYCRIPNAEGRLVRFILQPWQEFYVRALYGWRDRITHRRRYKRGLVGVARGNGKSTLGAGFGIKGLIGEGHDSPLVIGAGTDRENAGIIFGAAATMAEGDPRLKARLLVRPAAKRIVRRSRKHARTPGRGLYRVLGAEAAHAHGYHPTRLIIDDLQAQPSEEFITVLQSAQVTVADPLTLYFMTAGFDRATIGWEEWEHALRVLEDPSLDEALLPAIYRCDPTADFDDPAEWRKANPNLGVSVREDFIAGKVREMRERPSKRPGILRLHFNVWTEGEFMAWVPVEEWEANDASEYAEDEFAGRSCYIGVQAPSTIDIASVVYFFPAGDDGIPAVIMDAFVPADTVRRLEVRDQVSYQPWLEQGWLTETEGSVRDDAAIVAQVKDRAKAYVVQEIAINPRGAANLMTSLDAEGFDVVQVLPSFGAMAPAMSELERLIMSRAIAHGGNRLLSWMIGNLQARSNADGDQKPDAEKSRGNISGPVALFAAQSRAIAGGGGEGEWVAS